MLTRINHVVVVVDDLERAAADWERILGIPGRNRLEGTALRMRRLQFDVGDAYFALCEPLDEGSVFHSFLQKRGEGIYAVSFDVEGFDELVSRIREQGGSVTGDERSAWVHPRHTHGVNLGLHPVGGADHLGTEPSPFKAFRSIVVAVHDGDAAADDWERYLGLEGGESVDLPAAGMRWLRFDVADGSLGLELAEPLGASSRVRDFLERDREGIYSISVAVGDVAAVVLGMQRRGVRLLGDIETDSMFVEPAATHGVLLGLVE
jgi:catechol 2,3-dioxygenase-like lactoylglutathione lyase family enzyme